jgi:hypothetical protein
VQVLYRSALQTTDMIHASDSEEDFAAVHPEDDEPKDDEDEGAFEQGGIGGAEYIEEIGGHVALEVGLDEGTHELPHAVEGDGIDADDDEGKGQAFKAAGVNGSDEGGEDEGGPAGAADCPGGGSRDV